MLLFNLLVIALLAFPMVLTAKRDGCAYGLLSEGEDRANPDWRAHKWDYNHPDRAFSEPEKIPLEYGGKHYSVYSNAYLTMIINTACNADCGFCIQHVNQLTPNGDLSLPSTKSGLSPTQYAEQTKTVLEFLQPISPSISISGGEPTLSSRLPSVLEQIRQRPTPILVLHTNGTRLLHPAPGQDLMRAPPRSQWSILDHLLEANLKHLNVSIAHHDPERNALVMRMKPLEAEDLGKSIEQAVRRGVRPRFSLVLLKEGIHDLASLKQYLDWTGNMGVDDVWIRELSAYNPETTGVDRTTDYIDHQRVGIQSILKEVDHDPDFKLILQKSTENSYRESYRYKGIDVGFTSYRIIPPLVSLGGIAKPTSLPETVKIFVLHPNGSLNAAWQEWERIIIPAPIP